MMKFGFSYFLTWSLLLSQAIRTAACSSGELVYWCTATQTCIILGQDSCSSIAGEIFVGPGTLKRIPSATDATCLILTPATCGVNVNPGYAYTIGPGFHLGANCALSCVGYTMVKQETSGRGTGVFTSGGTKTMVNNFGTELNPQVSVPGYIQPVPGGRRFLRGEGTN